MTVIVGYAARFDLVDLGADVIRTGAFDGLPHVDAVPLLYMHRSSEQVGQIWRLFQDNEGLFARARISGTRLAKRFADEQSLGLSIGYRVRDFRREPEYRELLTLTLVEISIVERPMQPLCRAIAA